jgi:hypothetical protein
MYPTGSPIDDGQRPISMKVNNLNSGSYDITVWYIVNATFTTDKEIVSK